MSSLEALKSEIDRLSHELDEACNQKIQAAKYGLQVLEEKQALETKYEALESSYEVTKQELDIVKEALSHFQLKHREVEKHGVQHEESLLQETANRESELLSKITALEQDLRQADQEISRTKSEWQQLQEMNDILKSEKENFEICARNLRKEMDELKHREQRLICDYSELEEENLNLQKQLDSTKRVQIDFDSMKFELEKLYEEMQVLRFQSDEASELKEIAERQVEEALRSLQQEREQRLALKKEVDQLKNAELFNSNMSNLAQSVFGMQILVDDKVSSPAMFKQLQASMEEDGESDHYQPMDLFSEMHGAQVKKLELELSSANRQREEMQKQLDVCMRQLNCILFEEANRLVDQIVDVVNSSVADVMCLICDNAPESFKGLFKDDNSLILTMQQRFLDIVSRLKTLVENGKLLASDAVVDQQTTERIQTMEDDLRSLLAHAAQSKACLMQAQNEMCSVSETLSQFYQDVCSRSGLTPDPVMLEHTKSSDLYKSNNSSFEISYDAECSSVDESISLSGGCLAIADGRGKVENLEARVVSTSEKNQLVESIVGGLKSDFRKLLAGLDVEFEQQAPLFQVIDTVRDQVTSLSRTVDSALKGCSSSGVVEKATKSVPTTAQRSSEELVQQNVQLRSMLSTKREQIATLRALLKSNKQVAETALGQLRVRYQNEKRTVTETMGKLRQELKSLKEDAATFASVRAMFTARCCEYQAEVEDYQRQLSAAEEEKKTLNSLLRMAIQQKLALTQRLEELEMDRERSNMRRPIGSKAQQGVGRVSQQPSSSTASAVSSNGPRDSKSQNSLPPSSSASSAGSAFRQLGVRHRRNAFQISNHTDRSTIAVALDIILCNISHICTYVYLARLKWHDFTSDIDVCFVTICRRSILPTAFLEKASNQMMSTGSAVATKQFWENVYQVEMENFVDSGHVGEVWFGKACELRMVKWLEERENIIPKHSSILDLGCGNASLLLNLAKRGYSNLTGIDYSDSAIQLAQAKANREKLNQIHFQNLDLMINSENLHNKFDVILDKGTFDVISLREDAEKAVPVYISNVTRYYCRKSNLPRLFFIASCNNTRTELINYFETNFEIMDEEHFSTINFGGKTGTTLTCVIFSLKSSAYNTHI
ncbi:Protein bicaudal D -like protein 1 [Trichinella spiralis]|uniref:Protein-lysine N-methyltransferase T01_7519 n=1 Tax=Trichinella spiralis TaxID=6334 RepID=A0A0V1B3H2_TRISP|nr:Protein bicaudal D -like protein 1 [Trichinella spiralis]